MKSVTIKNPRTGEKLIKVSHTPKGYFAEALTTLGAIDCVIVADNNERITIPVRPK